MTKYTRNATISAMPPKSERKSMMVGYTLLTCCIESESSKVILTKGSAGSLLGFWEWKVSLYCRLVSFLEDLTRNPSWVSTNNCSTKIFFYITNRLSSKTSKDAPMI